MPPTERRGRIHTSTVTVVVLDPDIAGETIYDRRSERDYRVEWFSGSGAGGQHRNKHQNSCRLIHLPTGLVESRQGRVRETNLREARIALDRALDAGKASSRATEVGEIRRAQSGSGMRGDKTVTIRFQDDAVHHQGSGKRMSAARYMKGFMDEVWV